jgi:hypothetical protein
MSNAISGLLGALVGGLAAFGGVWLQGRNAARLQREQAARQEEERRRLVARRYLYQLGDAVDSLLHRVRNWAKEGGARWSETQYPGYWEITNLYVFGRALGAERLLALEGVYVELDALSYNEAANSSEKDEKLPQRAVEKAVEKVFGQRLFYYHRLLLAESVLDWTGDEFRLLTYWEFLRRYENSEWNLKSLLEPIRHALGSLRAEKLKELEIETHVKKLSDSIKELMALRNTNGAEVF